MAGRSGTAKAFGAIIFLDDAGKRLPLGALTVSQVEYRTLIHALEKASAMCDGEIEVWMDSELVVKQLNGEYAVKSENLKPLFFATST